ncbi:ABC transporter permease [Salarchaeum japonicum]|uniref:ABC transmembrane type-1 domain-containing protein n=1 Tax=Salarchaeum japonicum TaxID=555573 RepID=A0AAV3T028_9EURY|nr:ABC transporter permease [Salarchaeum japonicum]
MTGTPGDRRIDWTADTSRGYSPPAVAALAGLLAVLAAFAYTAVTPGRSLLGYEIGRLEWLWVASLWLFVVASASVVANADRGDARNALAYFARHPAAAAGTFVALAVFLAGTLGPVFLDPPAVNIPYRNQPPVYTSVPQYDVVQCYNPVGDRCYGTWSAPLGTNALGQDMVQLLVFGARNVVQLALVAVALIVPLATLVGTVSAYAGGRTDRVLAGSAESLKAVPALLVFFVWRWLSGDGTLFMLVVSFGLVNWGSVATVVRSRALDEVATDYVRAANASGASAVQVVRWHLLPNVSRSATVAAVSQIPLFITIEATLSFLRFGTPPSPLLLRPTTVISWGDMIGSNISSVQRYWWTVAIPVAALLATILAVSLLSDAIQDLLGPRST